MPFDYAASFNAGHDYQAFLDAFASDSDRERWQMVYDRIQLTADQTQLLSTFRRKMRVLVMAGAWCGDCVAQCPALFRFAEANPNIELRFVDNKTDLGLAAELQLCGAARVPQVIFMAEDDAVIGRYGDRTISRYRAMSRFAEAGEDYDALDHPLLGAVVAEWLVELERCQLILQTSPRLRKLHGE
jgi:thiol-disulfide isomerase/thioredoxin